MTVSRLLACFFGFINCLCSNRELPCIQRSTLQRPQTGILHRCVHMGCAVLQSRVGQDDGLNVVSESWDELTDKFRPTEERTPPTRSFRTRGRE